MNNECVDKVVTTIFEKADIFTEVNDSLPFALKKFMIFTARSDNSKTVSREKITKY